MNTIKYMLGIMILVLSTASLVVAENFDSRELLFDTMITGLDAKDLTDVEKEEIGTKVEAWVDGLSEDQVFSFNESLNNARHTPWRVDFTDPENWALLDLALDNNYNRNQIIALTKALESEAKFLSHYERTGKKFFLGKAEREKNKFLDKVDRFDDTSPEVPVSLIQDSNRTALLQARQESRSALKDVARQARLQAKTLAKETTRLNAKGFSRNNAKQLAQETRRELRKSSRPSKGNQGKNK